MMLVDSLLPLSAHPLPMPPVDRSSHLAPGMVLLRPVRRGGQVVDFEWVFSNTAAQSLLGRDLRALRDKRLHTVGVAACGPLESLDRYRSVLEQGDSRCFEQVQLVNGRQCIVAHHIARAGDGVAITLVNLSPPRRAYRRPATRVPARK